MSNSTIVKEHTQSFRVCRAQDQSLPFGPHKNVLNIHPAWPTYRSIGQFNEHVYKVKARCLQNPVTQTHQKFILWDDVRVLIKNAEYALDLNGSLIPFIVNDSFEE
jgi:hypothetical protein